jgi:uncharacterized secreted protein with C-terminal beta-propeller domain
MAEKPENKNAVESGWTTKSGNEGRLCLLFSDSISEYNRYIPKEDRDLVRGLISHLEFMVKTKSREIRALKKQSEISEREYKQLVKENRRLSKELKDKKELEEFVEKTREGLASLSV